MTSGIKSIQVCIWVHFYIQDDKNQMTTMSRPTKINNPLEDTPSSPLTIEQHMTHILTYLQIIMSTLIRIESKLGIKDNDELEDMSNDEFEDNEGANFEVNSHVKFEVKTYEDFNVEEEDQNSIHHEEQDSPHQED
jgi:hypothetical protein